MRNPIHKDGLYHTLKIGNSIKQILINSDHKSYENVVFDIRDYGKPDFQMRCTPSDISSLLLHIMYQDHHEATYKEERITQEEGFEIIKKILAQDVYQNETTDVFVKSYGLTVGNFYWSCIQNNTPAEHKHFDDAPILNAVENSTLKDYLTKLHTVTKEAICWQQALIENHAAALNIQQLLAGVETVIQANPNVSFPYMLKAMYLSAVIGEQRLTDIQDATISDLYAALVKLDEDDQKKMTKHTHISWFPPLFLTQSQFLEASTHLFSSLKKQEKKLKQLHERKNTIVEDYTHKWTNLLMPKNVYTSAQILGKDYPEEFYNILLHVYNNEFLLRQQSYMLSLRHANKIDELKNYIMNQEIPQDAEVKDTYGIDYFVNYALQLVMLRLFFDTSDRFEAIRAGLTANGFAIKNLRHCFYKHVFGNKQSARTWFSQEVYPITFSLEDEAWEEVEIHPATGAAAFLIEVLAELTLNAFSFGLHSNKGALDIQLDLEEIGIDYFLAINYTNKTEQQKIMPFSGLDSLNELLLMVNRNSLGKNATEQYVHTENNNGSFHAKVHVAEGLLLA